MGKYLLKTVILKVGNMILFRIYNLGYDITFYIFSNKRCLRSFKAKSLYFNYYITNSSHFT